MKHITFLILLAPALAFGQNSGFLTDYDSLRTHTSEATGLTIDVYIAEDAEERLSSKFAVMVDLPELIISDDSKYKSIPPEDAYIIAEGMRRALVEGMTDEASARGRTNFRIAEEPGADVTYLRFAFSNLHVRKNKRGVLGYTPIGAVAKGVKDAVSDTMDKTTLVQMTFEAEWQDAVTGEVLIAGVFEFGQRKDKVQEIKEDPAEWEATGVVMYTLGRRAFCRFENAHVDMNDRRDCIEIPLERPISGSG